MSVFLVIFEFFLTGIERVIRIRDFTTHPVLGPCVLPSALAGLEHEFRLTHVDFRTELRKSLAELLEHFCRGFHGEHAHPLAEELGYVLLLYLNVYYGNNYFHAVL